MPNHIPVPHVRLSPVVQPVISDTPEVGTDRKRQRSGYEDQAGPTAWKAPRRVGELGRLEAQADVAPGHDVRLAVAELRRDREGQGSPLFFYNLPHRHDDEKSGPVKGLPILGYNYLANERRICKPQSLEDEKYKS